MTVAGPAELSYDEKLAAFDSVPLFMKSLPEDDTDDAAISALQSLAFDGTPNEVARNFKEQGNDYFKGKRYREAKDFYTQGVDAHPPDVILQEVLLCNRAACQLELQNYGSVLRDCSKAITLNPKSSKAYYRSALALVALERLAEAVDCCDRCLIFESENKGVIALRERAHKIKVEKDKKEAVRLERIKKEELAKRKMNAAFKARNLIPMAKPDGPDGTFAPQFDPEDPTEQTLMIPVFFLYPQYATSDVIQQFGEDAQFSAHLAAMFPPGADAPLWDIKHEYLTSSLVIYAMTHHRRLLKVGKKMTLRDVCTAAKGKDGEPRDGLELKDGCLTFVVVPKGEVERKWVEEYKSSRNSA